MRHAFIRPCVAMLAIFASIGAVGAQTANNPWTGFYAGGNVGAAFGILNNQLSMVNNPVSPLFYQPVVPGLNKSGSGALNSTQFMGGLDVGYNRQINNNIVLGLELSYDYLGLDKAAGGTFYYTNTSSNNRYYLMNSASAKQMSTLRPRLGYLFDNYLPFITAGGAVTRVKFNQTYSDFQYSLTDATSLNKTAWGYTVGGGMEYAPLEHVSFKVEYLYTNFGNRSTSNALLGTGLLTGLNANVNNSLNNIIIQTLLFGINVHFG